MRKLMFITIIALLSSCTNEQNKELSVDEVWGKFIETFGNYNVVKGIKTYSIINIVKSKSRKNKVTLKIKYPDKVYEEIKYANDEKVIYIVNGDTGIIKSPKGIESLNNDEIANFRQMALIFPEIHYKQLGYKMTLKDDTIIKGKELYNIEITTNDGIVDYLINKNNFQVFQTISDGFTNEIIETKRVNGVRLIKTSKFISGRDTMIGDYIYYELNGKIDDNIFELK